MKSGPVVPDVSLPYHHRYRDVAPGLEWDLLSGPTLLWIVSIWCWWFLSSAVLYINSICA